MIFGIVVMTLNMSYDAYLSQKKCIPYCKYRFGSFDIDIDLMANTNYIRYFIKELCEFFNGGMQQNEAFFKPVFVD